MKKIITFLLVPLFVSCASAPQQAGTPPKEVSAPNWMHIFDNQNRIAASVDTNDGKVVYYQSEDVAFKSLFAAVLQQMKKESAAKEAAAKAAADKKSESKKK